MESVRFEFRYDPWCGWLLGLLGMGRRFSHVTVGETSLRVVMGWAFRVDIAKRSILSVEADDGRVLSRGVHGWRGRWLVNGSGRGLVKIVIEPGAPSRVVGLPGRLRELHVSLTDPGAFVAAVA